MPVVDAGPRGVEPRRHLHGADLATLVALGYAEPPPRPSDGGPPQHENRREKLLAALADAAGAPPDAEDVAAVDRLAALPAGTLDVVARWIRRGRPRDGGKT